MKLYVVYENTSSIDTGNSYDIKAICTDLFVAIDILESLKKEFSNDEANEIYFEFYIKQLESDKQFEFHREYEILY